MLFSFILRRLLLLVPVLFGITLMIFLLVQVSGDPVSMLVTEDMTPADVEALRQRLGLDAPYHVQYANYILRLLQGDFGYSLRYSNQPVLPIVAERLPATLQLTAAAIFVSIAISFPAGVLAAYYRKSAIDHLASGMAVLGQAMPNFWLGIMLILVFSVQLELLPVSGRGSVWHLVLPAISLGTALAAVLTRLLRANLVEALSEDYVRTAHAKGLNTWSVVVKHAVRNSSLAYLTVLGLQVSSLMAGAVVTEQVFAWPGIGLLAIQAIHSRDMAVIQAIVLVATVIVLVVNLIVDLSYSWADPRIRYG